MFDVPKGVLFPLGPVFQHHDGFAPGIHGVQGVISRSTFGDWTKYGIRPAEDKMVPTEKMKWKARGERVHRRGLSTKTVINVDGDLAPSPRNGGLEKYTSG